MLKKTWDFVFGKIDCGTEQLLELYSLLTVDQFTIIDMGDFMHPALVEIHCCRDDWGAFCEIYPDWSWR